LPAAIMRSGGLCEFMKRTCTPEVCVRSRRRREVEGVVHRARRMVRREVQRLEVVEVVLDLRAVGELVAQAREDVGDALERFRDRMLRAEARAAARQADVDALGGQAQRQRQFFQRCLARGERMATASLATLTRSPKALRSAGGSAPSCLSWPVMLPDLPSRPTRSDSSASRSCAVSISARARVVSCSMSLIRCLPEMKMGKDLRPSPSSFFL
jgi:hypothetical protein